MSLDSLEKIEIQTSFPPDAAIIWLHGLGADGHDFLPIAEELALPGIRFIFPHAPFRPITINNGYEMRGWYDLYGLTIDSPQDASGIKATQQQVEALIENELKQGITAGRIVLAGFSQGGAIALHTGLRSRHRLGGILALSTYLPLKATLADEISDIGKQIPVMMMHGTFDTVISLDTALVSKKHLENAGCNLSWKEYPMAHSVCAEEINDIRTYLKQILDKA